MQSYIILALALIAFVWVANRYFIPGAPWASFPMNLIPSAARSNSAILVICIVAAWLIPGIIFYTFLAFAFIHFPGDIGRAMARSFTNGLFCSTYVGLYLAASAGSISVWWNAAVLAVLILFSEYLIFRWQNGITAIAVLIGWINPVMWVWGGLHKRQEQPSNKTERYSSYS